MGWFYNSLSGETAEESGIAALPYETGLLGWHEYPTQAALLAAVKAHPGWPQPTTNPVAGLGQAAEGAASSTAGNLLGLPKFTSAEWRSYAIRALKIVLGIALVITGVVQLTHVSLPKAVPVPV
jgi:hypothetical protein